MKFETPHAARILAVLSTALAGACASDGGALSTAAESRVAPGMTPTEVVAAIGPPATRMQYRAYDGPTWTYDVVGTTPERRSFKVDFDSNNHVVSAREQYVPDGG